MTILAVWPVWESNFRRPAPSTRGILHECVCSMACFTKVSQGPASQVQLIYAEVSDAWANDVQLAAGSEVRKLQPKQRTNTRCAWYQASWLQSNKPRLFSFIFLT